MCLKSVKRGVNINRILVIDSDSTDDTLDIARGYGAEIINDEGRGLGYARKLATLLCETEWICFVDSDVELPEEWHNKMTQYITPDVGAISSIALTVPLNDYERRISQIINKRRNRRRASDLLKVTSIGFTGASLIRKNLISDIKMPRVKCMEDYVFTQHVLRRARWLWVPIFVRHYGRFSERPSRVSIMWATARFLSYMGTPRFLVRRTILVIKSLFIAFVFQEPLYFVQNIKNTINALRGWFCWNKHVNKLYPVGYGTTKPRRS